jgi:amino acid adenylation domain-containing protein
MNENISRRKDLVSKLRRNLSSAAASALEKRLRSCLESSLTDGSIRPRAQEGPVCLSFSQQRMWFVDQLQPGTSAYTIPTAMRMKGPLDLEALRASLTEIIRRHETLRTGFGEIRGEPLQIISEAEECDFVPIDLTMVPEESREEEARRLVRQLAHQPFDLSDRSLFRIQLLKLGKDDHVLILALHHIVSDVWSMGVLFRELSALYQAFAKGEASPLPDLPIQYADFALWQREYLQGDIIEQQLDYWKRQLSGAPAILNLPTDHARPATQSFRGSQEIFTIPESVSEKLKALSLREGTTLFMTLLAAFNVFLSHYTAQKDIVVGSDIAGRTRPEVEGLIGFFVNALSMRTNLSSDPTFCELLAQVKETCLGAYAHQDLPFEKLVEELQPERSLSHPPIFQVMFSVQDRPRQREQKHAGWNGLKVSGFMTKGETSKFDLSFTVVAIDQGLAASIEYSRDLYERESIERMVGHYQELLREIAEDAGRRVSELRVVSAGERERLVREWSGWEERAGRKEERRLVHELIEEQAVRRPEAMAVRYEEQQLSYGELNRRANQLARELRRLGVGPEAVVGIAVRRSPEMIVSLLGTLKAGAAYLPLDPAYPRERLQRMLEDGPARLLLTEREVWAEEEAGVVPVVWVEELRKIWEREGPEEEGNAGAEICGEHLAYVSYTSGSTGGAKGVMMTHGALAAYVPAVVERFELVEGDRFLQFASWSFDVAVEEILPTLAVGAELVMWREVASGVEFGRVLKDAGVTVCELPTAYWQEWVREMALGQEEVAESLRLVIVGGEKNNAESVRRWRQVSGGRVRLLHVYGVTEAGVSTSFYELGKGQLEAAEEEVMPLGRPLHNSEIYVLDERLEPVATGVYGELYLGGSSLGRGYLGNAAATAANYLPHPFSEEKGARLYRTGDVGRWRGAGVMEFFGRADTQVKIRGHRVELGEIESALRHHQAIREAVAIVKSKGENDNRIVAYLVFKEHARKPARRKLRHYLKERLPPYMIPSEFVSVSELSVTSNGKIDRQALPEPDWAGETLKPYVAPTTTIQLRLQQIWEDLFGFHPIGITDDFFELGGHSLLAVRLVSAIHKQFGQDLPLSVVFQGATIERLDVMLTQNTGHSASPLVALQLGGSKRPFFCAHGVGGNVVNYMELAQQLGPDRVVYGLQTPLLEFDRQFNRLEDMAANYVEAIRGVQAEGPYLLGGWSMGGLIVFEMANQLRRLGQEVGLLAIMDVRPPADEEGSETQDADLIRMALEFTLESLNISLDLFAGEWPHIMHLSSDDRLRFIIEKAQAAQVLHKDFGLTQVRRIYDQINVNFRLLRGYQPQPYPGEITLFKAKNGEFENEIRDFEAAWTALAHGGLTTHIIHSTHFQMLEKPHVKHLADLLRDGFDQVERGSQLLVPKQRQEPAPMLC